MSDKERLLLIEQSIFKNEEDAAVIPISIANLKFLVNLAKKPKKYRERILQLRSQNFVLRGLKAENERLKKELNYKKTNEAYNYSERLMF